MNYATERLQAAAKAVLAVMEGEGRLHHAPIEELRDALFYFDAHGDKPQLADAPYTVSGLSSFDYELLADALDVLDPDGSEATKRKQELEAWARAMAATGVGYLPPLPVQLAIHLDGGIVQGTVANQPGVTVHVVDYDTEGGDTDRLFEVPQDDGSTERAYIGIWEPDVDPAFIQGVIDAQPATDDEEAEEAA